MARSLRGSDWYRMQKVPMVRRRLAAILVSDLVGSSRIAHEHEALALELIQRHARVLKPFFEAHGGRVIKSLGDGFLVEFASALAAISCAVQGQAALASADSRMSVRIGVHVCDVEDIDGDIYGDGVNVACRIQAFADPGGVCLTEDAYRQVRGKAALEFESMGARRLHNIDEPVVLYRVVGERADSRRSACKGIAVLPFLNLSANPENEFFCDGLADELINALTKLPDLRVLSRTSSFAFKGKQVSTPEIGRILGIDALVEGSVRRSDQQIRVTAQLIDVDADEHLWSDTYDRKLSDIFAVQEEIARNVALALSLALTDTAIEPLPPVDVRAYDLFLKGNQAYFRGDLASFRVARSFYRQAVEIAPDFARAWAALAQCAAYHCLHWQMEESILAEARSAGARAMQIAPESPEAWVAQGLVLTLENRYEEGCCAFEQALKYDERSYDAWYALGRCDFANGDFHGAIVAWDRAAQVRPDDYQCIGLVLSAYKALGDEDGRRTAASRALPVIRKHREMHPDDARASYFEGSVHSVLGQSEEALRCLRDALAIGPEDTSILYNVACVFALLGRTDDALDYLGRAAEAGFVDAQWTERDDDFAQLRSDPRFVSIVNRIRANRSGPAILG